MFSNIDGHMLGIIQKIKIVIIVERTDSSGMKMFHDLLCIVILLVMFFRN